MADRPGTRICLAEAGPEKNIQAYLAARLGVDPEKITIAFADDTNEWGTIVVSVENAQALRLCFEQALQDAIRLCTPWQQRSLNRGNLTHQFGGSQDAITLHANMTIMGALHHALEAPSRLQENQMLSRPGR